VETVPTVAHTQKRYQYSDTACRDQQLVDLRRQASSAGPAHAWVPARRACSFLITSSDTITDMTNNDRDAVPRVPVLVRLQVPIRDGLRSRAAQERASMCGYLEGLINRDLDESEHRPFMAIKAPTFAAKGRNGEGRPTKGVRATVMLRIEPGLRERIHQRAESLHLTTIDYFESLVSQDISAAHTDAGEAITFDRTA